MKKLLSFILILTLVISCVSMITFTASAATYGKLTYTVSNGEVTITDCDASASGALTIPSTINGYPVTSIGYKAFYGCSSLTSITIPYSVTSIGSGAFFHCSSLTSITIPDSVTSIGSSAFFNCSSLTRITIPDSVTSIGDYAFSGCSSLTSITIPDSVTSIGDWAFRDCISLTSIAIPDSVTSIGRFAFEDCSSLTSMTIPDSVISIGSAVFGYCSNLASITVDANNEKYYSQGNCIIIKDTNTIVTGCKNSVIPDSVTSIGDDAFLYCSGLTSITIPDSVTNIGNSAFSSCSSLTSITIPDSVTSIGSSAFSFCSGLTSVYYRGAETQWNEISIGSYNTTLTSATRYYNSCIQSANHTYDNSCDTICNVCEQERTITHNYRWVIDKENNCGVDGIKHEECTVCHVKRNENTVINATGNHVYDNVCDAECNVCEGIRVINHTYDNACDVNCNECGNIRTVPDHSYTLNDNHTCDICKYSKTPEKPIVESKTNSSVTLIKYDGFEYSKDGVLWQNSNEFNNLLPDTTYTFYQRVKASSIANVSEISEGISVTFKSAQSAPSEPVILNFTDTVITLRPIQNGEYSLDGILWQDSNVFNNLLPGTTYTFYQRYKETDSFEASNISSTSFATEKAEQTLIPNAPTLAKCTATSITLNAVEGCEYSLNGTTWQTSTTFTGLSCGTEYTFYQRYKENETYYVGKKSSGATFKTDKGTQTAPSAPTLLSKTHNTVTLNKVDGYEYSFDGITWQTSNVFTGLEPKTNYMFYQRKAETDKYYASASSTYLIVKTAEEPQFIYGDVNGDGLINKKDDLALRMHLASLSVTIDLDAADVFNDGTVNKKDLLLLKQYLAGWSVQLGK